MQTERDVSVRQRAVDLLYAMCDRSNAEEIVQEMLNYLETADYSIREEMVRKHHHHQLYGHQRAKFFPESLPIVLHIQLINSDLCVC